MPDISKLPELAELFGVTIDHLLGRSSLLVEKAVLDKLEELPTLTVEEVAGTAPLLPPRQIDALTDRLMAQEHRPDMTALLPFLPTEMVDELLRQQANQEGSLVRYAPFASEDAIDEIALSRSEAGKSFMELAPFISEDALNKIVFDRLRSGKNINQLLPFVDQSTILQLYEAGTKEPS